ncbi:S8 family peptidase [Ammoniphilus resinae]|uniref:Subtilisin family serine protease n=1 Tax=Ammoniphilus resinae TaxID=861532 RepID=A0ABS4GU54_9BACL|nr:S8 family peptidase [Ammoniphilus resinae]MBP1933786.1 subtilisin family serine protease [Ammoniphilus resinae]
MKQVDPIILCFHEEQEYLHFCTNLPKKIRKRMRHYPRWHCCAMEKDDYNHLKERMNQAENQEHERKVSIESNVQYHLHETVSANQQITPWGVSAVKAPEVWKISTGSGVRVGILDTGIDGKHPDLRENIKGGVNTVDRTSPFIDQNGHGTHVAGTVAALNNDYGVVGVAPNVELYALKAFSKDGSASLTDIAEAIHWAIDHKIQIINMSFGSRETSTVLHRAIKEALKHGILMIASSGNAAETLDYPAGHKEVLAVGAIDRKGKVAEFSNFGRTLNYVQPGVDILSTWPTPPKYNVLSGTSMATPHLVGLCALLLSRAPHLTPVQVKHHLDRSTVKLNKISSRRQGRGVVVASKLLAQLND